MESMEALKNLLVALVKDAPSAALDRLQGDLARGATEIAADADLPGYLVTPLLRAWRAVGYDRVRPDALAMAIASTRAMKRQMEADSPHLDLVWTGPHSPTNIHTSTTASVLGEMIDGARLRILVVSYDLNRHNDLSVGVVEALTRARARGCKVIMAMHDDGSNFGYLTDLWPRDLPLPRLLRWTGVPGKPYAKLHAKLVVVDSEDLLITSANLTLHGLEHNIELGVRIRGRFAAEVDRHFGILEAEGVLLPYPGAAR